MVASTAHIPRHATSHAARLKEESYAVRHSEDLFYPFAVEVFGALHPALDRFLRSTTALCVEWRRTPRSQWLRPFLGSGCRWRFRGLRPSRSNGGRRRLDLGRLGMLLSWIHH
ncbi:unnamed protein product [Calypogeia fissa]